MERPLLVDVDRGVAVVTLNRPEARNALSSALLAELGAAMEALDADPGVDVVVLTGRDPAFCAGLDLKELGQGRGALFGAAAKRQGGGDGGGGSGGGSETRATGAPPMPASKPLIGAVNGPAVTGGLELALHCDLLVASERASFADTHARVGVHPGWGLTVLLPRAVGYARAVLMSTTSRFVRAEEALAWGLVQLVVPHDELLPTALGLAQEMRQADVPALRAILSSYREAARRSPEDGLRYELEAAASWQARHLDPNEVERRRAGILARNRAELSRVPARSTARER